jgi:hypothetical protein
MTSYIILQQNNDTGLFYCIEKWNIANQTWSVCCINVNVCWDLQYIPIQLFTDAFDRQIDSAFVVFLVLFKSWRFSFATV